MVGTETSLARLKIDQEEANEQIACSSSGSARSPEAVDRAELMREVKANEEAYLLYRKKVEEARISEAMDEHKMMNVTIAEEAPPL